MSDDFKIVGDEAREARIVAVILGQASDFEREEVDRLCEENAELQVFRRRLEAVHGLIGESRTQNPESKGAEWKLSKEKRAAVLAKLGEKETVVTLPQKKGPFLNPAIWQVAACAAVVIVLVGLAVPDRMKALAKSAKSEQGDSFFASKEVELLSESSSVARQASESHEIVDRVRKPQAPNSSLAKVIASNTASPTAIPVPQVSLPAESTAFGNGDDFGNGWGGEGLAQVESVPQLENLSVTGALFDEVENKRLESLAKPQPVPAVDSPKDSSDSFGYSLSGEKPEAESFVSKGKELQKSERWDFDADLAGAGLALGGGGSAGISGGGGSFTDEQLFSTGALQAPTPDFDADELGASRDSSFVDLGADPFADSLVPAEEDLGSPKFSKKRFLEPRFAFSGGTHLSSESADLNNLTVDESVDYGWLRSSESSSDALAESKFDVRSLPSLDFEEDENRAVAGEMRRSGMEADLVDGTLALGRKYRRTGEYDVSGNLRGVQLEGSESLREEVNLESIGDPVRANASVTSEHSEKVDEVRRLLYQGEGHHNLADYDKSEQAFRKVLKVDPHNKAARRWLERNAAIKSDYYRAAYDQTRAQLLTETDAAWELTVPSVAEQVDGGLKDELGLFSALGEREPSPEAKKGQVTKKRERPALQTAGEPAEITEEKNALSLVAQLKQQEEKVQALQRQKERLNQPSSRGQDAELVELATDMHDYSEAAREYESSLALLQELKLKHSSERVALRSPREPVSLQKDPVIPKKRGGLLGLGDYESEALVKVNNRGNSFGSTLGVTQSKQYFETQSEVVKAKKTLSLAAEELDLAKKWGVSKAEAVARLKKKVNVKQRKGTDLLEIAGKSKDPKLAQEIAGAVSNAYLKRRAEEEAQRGNHQLAALNSEIEDQEDRVQAKRKVLNTITRITGRPYFEGSGLVPESMERATARMSERNLFELKKNRDQFKIYLDKLESLRTDQLLRYASELPVDNNSVRSIHMEFLEAKRELESVKAGGLSDKHPSVKAHQKRVDSLRKDAEAAAKELNESLQTNFKLINEQLIVLEGGELSDEAKKRINNRHEQELLKLEALKKEVAKAAAAKLTQQTLAMDEKDAATQGDSTFSLHVSDVSFKLAKAALEQGKWPETVRVEEFVNAFSYGERALAAHEKVGVAMEQAAHPFLSQRNLLRVALQTAATGRGAGVPLQLTVVLDKSGSMERVDRAAAVDEAFRVLVEQLNPGDKVTLVGFSRTPSLLADHVDGAEGARLLEILRETPSEGGTNVEEALKLARAKSVEHFQDGAQNRVILLTDGIANLGQSVPEKLMTLVEGMKDEGVAFDACGVGVEGLNDEILEALTRKGDGRYYLLGSTEESGADFARQMAGALRPAAKNVKVQVEWNAERVGKWRLYGFEKHELKKEDFRNDSVDAAEMAAEEEGVALYHVEVKPDGEGPLGVARVRFLDVESNEMVEREWQIPYEGEAAPLSSADGKVRLAGVAGLTAEKLARSPIGERVEWDELLENVRQLKAVFPKERRVRDLEAIIEQAKGLE